MRRAPTRISSRSAEMVGASAPRSRQNPSGARRRWAARMRRIAHHSHTTANASAPMIASAANTPTIVAKITSRLMLVLLEVVSAASSLLSSRPAQPASPVPFAAQRQHVRADARSRERPACLRGSARSMRLFVHLPRSPWAGEARHDSWASPGVPLRFPFTRRPRATAARARPRNYALAASVPASASTPRSLRTSSSAVCQAGATLFLVTCTRTRLPTTSPPSLSCPNGRRSRRTEA
jgi:hypothetical protein